MKNLLSSEYKQLMHSASADVEQIISPIKNAFGVTSLVYHQNFNDGSEIRFSNQPDWQLHFFEKELYKVSGFEKHPSEMRSGLVVWSHLSHHQPILQAARSFNIDHGLTLIQKNPDGCEFFFIGTTPDKSHITNLLLNNQDFLQRFTQYFKDQAATLIKKFSANRIFIPNKYSQIESHEMGIPYQMDKSHLDLAIPFNSPQTTLSPRELTCARLLLQGYSARHIGEQIFLSPRTVETHIQHLKEKLNCRTKAQLIKKLIELKLEAF